jgi:protein-S-isoprenylcysteine O-methyltransferase Ste14
MVQLLPLYYLVFFGAAFAWPSWRTWKQTGINPIVLPRDDSAHGFIGAWFKALIGTVLVYTLASAMFPANKVSGALEWASFDTTRFIGFALLTVTFVWIILAQVHMGASWRIGIDQNHTTVLIETGLFRLSRNPIFLGMRLNMLGLFLVSPSGLSLAVLIASEILIGAQVRLEEAHLRSTVDRQYSVYCKTVRRWL